MNAAPDGPKKYKPRAGPPRRNGPSLTLILPHEFVAVCERDQVTASEVLKGFIADLGDIVAWNERCAYASHGPKAREAARAYYAITRSQAMGASDRVGDPDEL